MPDQVTGIEPEGRALQAGDTVVVTYAMARAGGRRPGDSAGVTGAAVGGAAAP